MQNSKADKQQKYKKMVEQAIPNSPIWKNCLLAFLVGGIICTVGEVISTLLKLYLNLNAEGCANVTSIIMVFLGATLTGFGIYDKIGKVGGAGAAVPITGFANAIVSPAMEFKREGLILGVGAKMFAIAGPVLVYGTVSSVIVGLIYFVFRG